MRPDGPSPSTEFILSVVEGLGLNPAEERFDKTPPLHSIQGENEARRAESLTEFILSVVEGLGMNSVEG
jgi:hypothetical protein